MPSPAVVVRAALSRLRSQFDWPLAATITVLVIMGLTNLWSATRVAPKGLYTQQLAWLAVGVIIFVAVALSDSRIFDRMAYGIYAVIIVVLVAVLVGGKVVNGSRRWVGIGPLGGQPSELAKVALILAFAKLFATDPTDLRLRPWRYVGIALGLFAVPGLLIAKQPDLGTALILFLIAMTVVLIVPLQLHVKLVTLGVEIGLGVLIYFFKLHDYQKRRLLTFLDPSLDPSGAGWHARQAIFAVGSGRWIGKGWTHGTQNQLQFLPEHWTDFPFAVWAEEWGFLGCAGPARVLRGPGAVGAQPRVGGARSLRAGRVPGLRGALVLARGLQHRHGDRRPARRRRDPAARVLRRQLAHHRPHHARPAHEREHPPLQLLVPAHFAFAHSMGLSSVSPSRPTMPVPLTR